MLAQSLTLHSRLRRLEVHLLGGLPTHQAIDLIREAACQSLAELGFF